MIVIVIIWSIDIAASDRATAAAVDLTIAMTYLV